MIRAVFFGTPELSVPFLTALASDQSIEVVGVVTQPDKPVGRKQILTPSPVKQEALRLSVPVFDFGTLKTGPARDSLHALNADLFVVVAYGKIIPTAILELPRLGCLNMHPSLLPRHRGPSPMQWAIREGDATTGISIMKLDAGMDTGPLLAQSEFPLAQHETLASLSRIVMEKGPALLVETLKQYASGSLTPIPQDESRATLTTLLEREDGKIDWTRTAQEIDRQIRAYDPWPGAWTVWTREGAPLRIKVLEARIIEQPAGTPGRVETKNGQLCVSAADRQLELLRIQPEGKSPMNATEFLRGYSDVNDATLG